MEKMEITLKLDLSSQASKGAGWYIEATVDDTNQVISPTYIETDAASGLAAGFVTALQSSDELPQIVPTQLVASGNNLIRAALENQLRFAEEHATRIPMLRKRLGQIPQPPQGS
jgi:hypothetical protein